MAKTVGVLLLTLSAALVFCHLAQAQQIATTLSFDNPRPPGANRSVVNGLFGGIDFGVGQWRWEAPYGPDPVTHIYFAYSSGTSRTFQFSPATKILNGVVVTPDSPGTLTLTDNLGQRFSRFLDNIPQQLVTTGWTQGSTTITVDFTSGWDLNVDQIIFSDDGSVPLPRIYTMLPPSATAGSAGLTLIVNGTGFVPTSMVSFAGNPRPTTFVSTTQLTAAIPASDIGSAGAPRVTVSNPGPGGGISNALAIPVVAPSDTFLDDWNRPDGDLDNGWTQKDPGTYSISSGRVVSIDTTPFGYHDEIAYRPMSEDQSDVEVSIEFQILPGLNFPQVHTRVQRNTLTQPFTLDDYMMLVDGFEPPPGRAIIARQPPLTGVFECYMLAIPFPSPLTLTDRYRMRLRVVGSGPVVLTGFIDRFDGTNWQVFASGTIVHDGTTQRDPSLFCDPQTMPPPLTTGGAVGFAKWWFNNDVYGTFTWTNLSRLTTDPTPASNDTAIAAEAVNANSHNR